MSKTKKPSKQQEKQMQYPYPLSPAEKEFVRLMEERFKEPFSPYGKFAQQRDPTPREWKAAVAAYKAYCKQRRRLGKAINPATAETMFDYADIIDPYGMLPPYFHEGCSGRESFALPRV
jgi:hypothetical protein